MSKLYRRGELNYIMNRYNIPTSSVKYIYSMKHSLEHVQNCKDIVSKSEPK